MCRILYIVCLNLCTADCLPPGGTGCSSWLGVVEDAEVDQAAMPVVGCVFAAVQEHLCEGSKQYTPAFVLHKLVCASHMAACERRLAAVLFDFPEGLWALRCL
jgi:hypothetical protein